MIGNGLSTIPLYILAMGAKLTPEPSELGFENEVQDILGCQTRRKKINSPSVGFVWSQLCKKISQGTDLLLNLPHTTISAKPKAIFAPKLSKTLHPLDLSSEYVWVCTKGLKSLGTCPEVRRLHKVRRLGLAATQCELALGSVHKGLGPPQTFHILVCDFWGLHLNFFFTKNS